MLRYFAYSVRNFRQLPDLSDHRMNWEIWVTFAGEVRPRFRAAPDREPPAANFWVMPPGARYRWMAETTEVERAVFHFAYIPHELEQVVRREGYFCRWLDPEELAEMRAVAAAVGSAYRPRGRLSAMRFQRAALDLALVALRGEADLPVSSLDTWAADRAERAVEWYKEHLREAPKFSRLAAEMNISISHLRRLFQTHFRQSPKAVFDKVRLGCAADLLAGSTATLDAVASESGFHSATDFCRVFKKHFGYPPNVWRRTVGKFDRELVPVDSGIREVDLQRLLARVLARDSLAGTKQPTSSSRGGESGYGEGEERLGVVGPKPSRRSAFTKSRVRLARPSVIVTTPVR